MIKRLFKKSTPIRLGRWGVTYEASVLEKRINWANHDHCGSEVCENKFIEERIKTKESKNPTKQNKTPQINNNNTNSKYDNIHKFDPLIPYCM